MIISIGSSDPEYSNLQMIQAIQGSASSTSYGYEKPLPALPSFDKTPPIQETPLHACQPGPFRLPCHSLHAAQRRGNIPKLSLYVVSLPLQTESSKLQ